MPATVIAPSGQCMASSIAAIPALVAAMRRKPVRVGAVPGPRDLGVGRPVPTSALYVRQVVEKARPDRPGGGRGRGCCARTVHRVDVISCEGLTKRFGPAIAVNGLDLAVSSGQVYGFLGPNGAGKTTTIRMLLGLIAPSAGQIRLLGRRLPDPRVVAQTGSMIEEPVFYPWMTGRVNLEVLGATGGGCPPDEVARVLSQAGLSDVAARKVRTLLPGHAPAAGDSRGDARTPAIADHR
jgi:ABC-type multidrug transport system fused ATPase/permease subunit